MPSGAPASSRRYAIRSVIGEGGMGVVYRAYDNETRREVTIKTLRDLSSPAMLDLFRKECEVLSRLNHPNIVDIYDIGEFVAEDGKRQPYFVMPLLPGVTLDRLIDDGTRRLTVERAVDIVAQACRGLHAAHERGLVHRDIKPSNIFVLEDDAVKLIDFGVAHLATAATQTTVKGTLHYMAPEQVQAKKPTPLSDIFSLGVVCYEALTRQRPFKGDDPNQVVEAILHTNPPLASELNPGVSRAVSQVVHKALAKHPVHRFASMREFGDMLQKAVRGETVELFDEAHMLARLERARKALAGRELEFAGEILSGIEGEGYTHPDVTALRREIDRARRNQNIGRLLDRAHRCFAEEEPQLALQKIQEILEIEPGHPDAVALQREIENKRSTEQLGKWMTLAGQHLANNAYGHARQALEDVLRLRPDHNEARKMLSLLEVRESEHERIQKERERRYGAAVEAWRKGEVSAALTDLEQVMRLLDQVPDKADPGRASRYQNFYNQVRSEHDALRTAYEEARRLLGERDFPNALATCEEVLAKHPGHALFQALKVDVEEAQRQSVSAFIAKVDREVEAETDLDRRVKLLSDALAACPGESRFERALQLTTSKRELVNNIAQKARRYEEARQFGDALNQWGMLNSIYPSYPGLAFEMERLVKRRDRQVRVDAKARSVQQIDESLGQQEWTRALEQVRSALSEFPEDEELKTLEQLAAQGHARSEEAAALLERGCALRDGGSLEDAIAAFESARQLDDRNGAIAGALVNALLAQARPVLDSDPDLAAALITRALEISPGSTPAKTLRALLDDRNRERFVDHVLSEARRLQASGDLEQALAMVDQGLTSYPREIRLAQLKALLERLQTDQQRAASRSRDLEEARSLETRARQNPDGGQLRAALESALVLLDRHSGDREFEEVVACLRALAAAGSAPAPAEAPVATSSPQPSPAAAAEPLVPPARILFSRRPMLIGVACAVTVALLPVLAYRVLHRSPKVAVVAVAVSSEPGGAVLSVDGQAAGRTPLQVSLTPGVHRIEASASGYATIADNWDVRPGFLPPALHLTPLPGRLQIVSDLPDIRPLLDGDPKESLIPGSPLDIPNLPVNGQYRLQFTIEGRPVELSFHVAPASAPEVQLTCDSTAPLAAVATFGSRGRFLSCNKLNVSVDGGQSYRETGPQAIDFPQLPPDGILMVRAGSGTPRSLVLTQDAAPGVNVFLLSSTPTVPLGALSLDVPVGGFTVLIDNKRFPVSSKGPPFSVYNVPEGDHKITIQKAGHRVEPESRDVKVKGRIGLKFNLVAMLPHIAIRGGIPGTRVAIGSQVYSLDAAGDIQTVELQPGEYEIAMSKKGYRESSIRRTLSLGDDVTIGLPESRLKPISGTIQFTGELSQPGLRIRITQKTGEVRIDGPRTYTPPIDPVVMPVGDYEIEFLIPGYKSDFANVSLPEGVVWTVPAGRLPRL